MLDRAMILAAMLLGSAYGLQLSAATVFGAEFVVNGAAVASDHEIVLTPEAFWARGSAFLADPVVLTPSTNITVTFSFSIHGGSGGADGMTLAFVNDPLHGPHHLGLAGGNLGFFPVGDVNGNPLPFGPALGIAIDTFQNTLYGEIDGNHLSVITHAAYVPIRQETAPSDLNSGSIYTVWVDYTAANKRLHVYFGNGDSRPSAPLMSETIDLPSLLGDRFYAGFTAATGGLANEHRITAMSIVTAVPEPKVGVTLCIGLMIIALRLRARATRATRLSRRVA